MAHKPDKNPEDDWPIKFHGPFNWDLIATNTPPISPQSYLKIAEELSGIAAKLYWPGAKSPQVSTQHNSGDQKSPKVDQSCAEVHQSLTSADQKLTSAEPSSAEVLPSSAEVDQKSSSADQSPAEVDQKLTPAGEKLVSPQGVDQKLTSADQQSNSADQKLTSADQKLTSADQSTTPADQKLNSADQKLNLAGQSSTSADQSSTPAHPKLNSAWEKVTLPDFEFTLKKSLDPKLSAWMNAQVEKQMAHIYKQLSLKYMPLVPIPYVPPPPMRPREPTEEFVKWQDIHRPGFAWMLESLLDNLVEMKAHNMEKGSVLVIETGPVSPGTTTELLAFALKYGKLSPATRMKAMVEEYTREEIYQLCY